MRLIDAEKFVQQVTEVAVMNGLGAVFAKELRELVNAQPTAYDVDGVVERLRAESERWKDSYEEYGDPKEAGVSKGLKFAVATVMAGGLA